MRGDTDWEVRDKMLVLLFCLELTEWKEYYAF